MSAVNLDNLLGNGQASSLPSLFPSKLKSIHKKPIHLGNCIAYDLQIGLHPIHVAFLSILFDEA